jgi:sugar phosphate isomerase/epimerase
MITMFPSACIWVFPGPIEATLISIKQTAFHFVDVRPDTLDCSAAAEAMKSLGLRVSCVDLDGGGNGPGKGSISLSQGLEKAHAWGARAAYIRSCANARDLKNFEATAADLANKAAEKGIRLCIEHVPGSALSTARETLSFIQNLNHPNVFLLLDIGHTILSREKPWEIVAAAGPKLGYVQMNDNDGKKDRHWALLDGRLTCEELSKTLDALNLAKYEGTLGLQLSGKLRVLAPEFSRNRNLLLRLQIGNGPKSFREPESRRKN